MRWDADQARAFLAWILARHAALGGVTELRALGRAPRRGVWSAFVGPGDLEAVLDALAPLPGSPRPVFPDWPRSGEANLYFGLNPVKAEAVPPRGSALFSRVNHATRDRDVLAYSMFVVDVDPDRLPHDRAATDAEKAEALAVATAIRDELRSANVSPMLADSGNGYHLLVPLVPVTGADITPASREVRTLLRALDRRFSTKTAHVDTSIYNPSRILKLYGSLAMKGDDRPELPHRLASIDLSVIPADVDVVGRLAARAGFVGRSSAPGTVPEPSAGPATPPEAQVPVALGSAAPRSSPTPWAAWRAAALTALRLEAVYRDLLTGRSTNGWAVCRDPESPSGDQNPSAGVADTTTEAERGSFHSFRDGRTLSVFDFLVAQGQAADFPSACARLAELVGIPVPHGRVGDSPVDRLRVTWEGTQDDGRRHAAVREAVAATAHLPAIEQRQAFDAIGDTRTYSAPTWGSSALRTSGSP